MKDINILIIEDDEDINNLLKEILEIEEYNIKQGFSGTEGKLLFDMEKPDLILLDLMLPGLTGEEIVKLVREESKIPIIIISAKLDVDTKVELLKIGADDFIEKPFDIKEVMARVKAQLRRYTEFSIQEIDDEEISYKNIVILDNQRKVLVNGEEIKLTVKEYDILKLLLQYPKKVFTKSNLYQSIWGEESFMDDNTLNVHISNLRNKIHKFDQVEEYIETVWGIGFKLKN